MYTFYRGDFTRLTDEHIPDNSVHMIFTDPPYGGEFLSVWGELGALAARVLVPGGLLVTYSGQYHLPRIMHDLDMHLKFVWMDCLYTPRRNALMRPVRVKSRWKPMLIYVKGKYDITCDAACKKFKDEGGCRIDTGKTTEKKRKKDGQDVMVKQPVWTLDRENCSHTCRRGHFTRWWRWDTSEFAMPDKSEHPEGWTQSEEEARHYIELFTMPGDTVLDPMVGTGTTMFAALSVGRSTVGVEIEKRLHKVVEERLELLAYA